MLQAEATIADLLLGQAQEAVAIEAVAPVPEAVEATEVPVVAPEVLEVDLAVDRAHQEEVAEDSKSQKSILTH